MNRTLLGILIIALPLNLSAQMFPLSDHYIYNTLAINPAFAGCHDALSATLQYRDQWVGFKDAPKKQVFSVHAPLKNDRIGLGLLVDRNTAGIYKETSFLGNYAFRSELYNGKLALGLGFGVTAYNIAWDDLDATDADDAALLNNPASAVLPDFSLGAYYYTRRYFVGISLPLFLSHVQDENTGDFKIRNDFSNYNYFFTGGYEIDISPMVKIFPTLLVKYHPEYTVQVDYSVQFIFKDRIWIGMAYRSSKMLVGLLQCKLNDQLRIAYSYDFDFGSMRGYTGGSHEILLGYIFSYSRKVVGPRQF
jgi:type IX secretion system PorP/SprF family membrane protein